MQASTMQTQIEKVITSLNITPLPVVNLPHIPLLLELPLNSFTTLLATRKIKEVFVETHRIVPSQSLTITPDVVANVYKYASVAYETDISKKVDLVELRPLIEDYNARVLSVDFNVPLDITYAILLDGCVVIYTDKTNKALAELVELVDGYYELVPEDVLSRMIDNHIWETTKDKFKSTNLSI